MIRAVIGIEAIGRVVKDIVDRRMLLAPAIASKGAAFPVLAQELGTREFANQILVPQSHLLTSLVVSSLASSDWDSALGAFGSPC